VIFKSKYCKNQKFAHRFYFWLSKYNIDRPLWALAWPSWPSLRWIKWVWKYHFFRKVNIFRSKNLAILILKIHSYLLNPQFLSYKIGICYKNEFQVGFGVNYQPSNIINNSAQRVFKVKYLKSLSVPCSQYKKWVSCTKYKKWVSCT